MELLVRGVGGYCSMFELHPAGHVGRPCGPPPTTWNAEKTKKCRLHILPVIRWLQLAVSLAQPIPMSQSVSDLKQGPGALNVQKMRSVE